MKGAHNPRCVNQQPSGVCDCGLCFEVNLLRVFPPVLQCKVCKKIVKNNGSFVVEGGKSD